MKDIYAPLAANITKQCGSAHSGVNWTPSFTWAAGPSIIPINKGSYTEYHVCGDLNLSGTGYLNLGGSSPSSDTVIVIENGNLNLGNNANVSAMRTAIVMTGDSSYASQITFPNGNGQSAKLDLSMATGAGNPWQGVALYQDPATKTATDNWGPGAELDAVGLVYLGNSNVSAHGITKTSNAKCTKFVMNTMTYNGNIDLNNTNPQPCPRGTDFLADGSTVRLAK